MEENEKTYNPFTGKYDYLWQRDSKGQQPLESYTYGKGPTISVEHQNYLDDVINAKKDYNDIVKFQEDSETVNKINNSGYNDVVGRDAYLYTHGKETLNKYKELIDKYGIDFLKDELHLDEDTLAQITQELETPQMFEGLDDNSIKSISDTYLNHVNRSYDSFNFIKENGKDLFQKGISEYSDLNEKEQESIKQYLKDKLGDYNFDETDYNNVLRNNTFKAIFGEDVFAQYNKEERDQKLRDFSISMLIEDKFKGDPLLDRIQNLTTEERIKLYKDSRFLTYDEANKEEAEAQEKFQNKLDTIKEVETDYSDAFFMQEGAKFMNDLLSSSKRKAKKDDKNTQELANERRSVLIEEYERASNAYKLEQATPEITELNDYYLNKYGKGELDEITIEEEFESTFEDILPEYFVFKGDQELKKFDHYDMMEYLSIYKTVAEKDPYAAAQIVRDKLKTFIDDEQGFATHFCYGLQNAIVGTIPEIINWGIGIGGIGVMMAGEDAYADYMNSKFVSYINDASTYGTLSPTELNKARKYGVSQWQGVSAPGTEYDIFTAKTIEETLKMGKYVLSSMATSYLGGQAMGVLGKGFTAGSKAAQTYAGISKGVSTMGAQLGMAQTMAKSTFDETKRLAGEQIQDKINRELKAYSKDPIIQQQALNKYMNSDFVQTELDRVLKEAGDQYEKEIIGLNKQERKLAISKDQYLKQVKDEFLKNITDHAYQNIEGIIDNQYRNILENKYKEDYKNAELAAAASAKTQFALTFAKESIAGFTLDAWTIAPNARMKLNKAKESLHFSREGARATKDKLSVSDYLWTGIKRFGSEFVDETVDKDTENYSQGFGLSYFNDLTHDAYNPEAYLKSQNYTYNLLTHVNAGLKSVADGFFAEDKIYEGLIGGISGIGGVNPNIANMLSFNKEEYNKLSKLEKLNYWVSNGLISDIIEQQQAIKDSKILADNINKKLKENANILEDIHTLFNTYEKEQEAFASGSIKDIQNAKTRSAFELALMLEDPNMSSLPQIQEIVEKLQAFSEGNITEEDIKRYINHSENKEMSSQSNAEKTAVQTMQENAKEILSIIEKTKEAYKTINDSKFGWSLSDYTKKQLAFNKVFDIESDERLKALEKAITGNSTNYSTSTNKRVRFSSEEGYNNTIKAEEDAIRELEERKHTLEKRLNKLKKGKKAKHVNSIASIEFNLKHLNEALAIEKAELNSLRENGYQGDTVLSKEEIMALNPEERALMLFNDNVYKLHNTEQQRIIDELFEELRMSNPELLNTIALAGEIYKDKRLNKKAYSRVIENDKIYDGYVNYMKSSFYNRTAKAALPIIKQQVYDELKDVSDNDLKEYLINTHYSSDVIKLYRKEFVEAGSDRERILKETEEILKTYKKIAIICDKEFNPAVSNLMKRIIVEYLKDTSITDEQSIYNALSELADNSEQALKDNLNTILSKLSNIKKLENRKRDNSETTKETKETLSENTSAQSKSTEERQETPQQKESDEIVGSESPNIAEQAKQEGTQVKTIIQDVTDEGNNINDGELTIYNGNTYPGFENSAAKEGKLVVKRGAEKGDAMNTLYDFLKNKGLNHIQEIIDYELANILQENPDTKVHFMMHKTNTSTFNNFIFAVIEYDENVKKHHNEKDFGGVITLANGKRYLVIGTVGTNFNKGKQHKDLFFALKDRFVKGKRKENYFKNNPNEEYFISEEYTQIKDIQTGRRIKQNVNETAPKQRKISDLLYDENGNYNEESNPSHLGNAKKKVAGYSSLSWIIQKGDDYIEINKGSKEIIPLNHPENNNGSVFLLVRTGNGKYLPIYINPTMYNEISGGALKNRIDNLLLELTSKDFERRKEAKDKLKQFLVLSDNDTISIGKKGFNSISIIRNGSVLKTFNLDADFNVNDFFETFKTGQFRINVTQSVLGNPTLVAEYDAAGALTTDVSVLHTRNASFTLRALDDNGKPIIREDAPTQPKRDVARNRYIQYGNTRYIIEGDVVRDETGNIITPDTQENADLITKLNYIHQIRNREPDYQSKGYNFFIINDSIDNPVAIKIGRSNDITIATEEQARKLIDIVKDIKEKVAKAEAAKKALEEIARVAEPVDLEFDSNVNTPVEEQKTAQTSQMPTASTPIVETSKSEIKNNINEAGKFQVESLQNSGKVITFADIYKDMESKIKLKSVFKEKGWVWKNNQAEMEKILKEHNVPIIGIDNIDTWMDIIKNCR